MQSQSPLSPNEMGLAQGNCSGDQNLLYKGLYKFKFAYRLNVKDRVKTLFIPNTDQIYEEKMYRMNLDSIFVSILPNIPHQSFYYEWHVIST